MRLASVAASMTFRWAMPTIAARTFPMAANPVHLEFQPAASLGDLPEGSFALSAGDGFEGDVYAHFHGVESLEFEEESLAELEQAAANLRPGQVLAIRHR